MLVGIPAAEIQRREALGRLSGRETVDFDHEIELAAGRPIPQIFAESGEETFRELERQITQKWARNRGGSSLPAEESSRMN